MNIKEQVQEINERITSHKHNIRNSIINTNKPFANLKKCTLDELINMVRVLKSANSKLTNGISDLRFENFRLLIKIRQVLIQNYLLRQGKEVMSFKNINWRKVINTQKLTTQK